METYDISPYDEVTGKGLIRHIFTRYGYHTGEIMVCIVANGSRLPHQQELVKALREIPGMTSITPVSYTHLTKIFSFFSVVSIMMVE